MIYSQKRSTLRRRIAAVLAGVLACGIIHAHHSFAKFDSRKLITVKGTVDEWVWRNPHAWIYIIVTKKDGTMERWALECGSPNMMSRWGWNAADLRVGDKITVDALPSRDGQHVAAVRHVFLPNGKVLVDPTGEPPDTFATGPKNVPTQPKGEAYQ